MKKPMKRMDRSDPTEYPMNNTNTNGKREEAKTKLKREKERKRNKPGYLLQDYVL